MLRIATSLRSALVGMLGATFAASFAHAQTPTQPAVGAVELSQGFNKLEASSSTSVYGIGAPALNNIFIGGGGMSDLPSVSNAPLSAVAKREDVTKLLDGNRIVRTSTTRLARDSQGRTRTEHMFPTPSGTQSVLPSVANIFDPLSGERVMLNVLRRTANVMPFVTPVAVVEAPVPVPPIMPQFSAPLMGFGMGGITQQSQVKETSLGEKMIEGVRAVGKRGEYSIPANMFGNEKAITVRLEQWFSPDLGVVLLSTQRSSAGIESTYKLEQIDRNEQDRALFSVPADFTKEDVSQRTMTLRSLRTEPDSAPPSN